MKISLSDVAVAISGGAAGWFVTLEITMPGSDPVAIIGRSLCTVGYGWVLSSAARLIFCTESGK